MQTRLCSVEKELAPPQLAPPSAWPCAAAQLLCLPLGQERDMAHRGGLRRWSVKLLHCYMGSEEHQVGMRRAKISKLALLNVDGRAR